MPQPYDYTVAQPNIGGFIEAQRAGNADRIARQTEQRQSALSRYLPQALEGDQAAQRQAMSFADPNQMMQLKQTFSQMDAQKLAQVRQQQGTLASLAMAAATPEQWPMVNAKAREFGLPELPFEQRPMIIAQAQTVSEMLEQTYKEKMLANDTSRTQAQNTQSYAAAAASRASAARGSGGSGGAPQGYQWARAPDGSVVLSPIKGGPADPNRVAPGEGVKVRASNAQLDALEQSLNMYLSDLDKTTPVGRMLSRGPEVSRVETGHTDLLMQMKNLYELGVLNGPDYMLMTKIVEDPTSLIQVARGTEGLKAQTDTVRSIINRSRNINNAKMGVTQQAPAQPLQQPPQLQLKPQSSRPTATGPNGERLVLSEDGSQWVRAQ